MQERQEVSEILKNNTSVWVPTPGPQKKALESEADILFYGGAAGGGKTDLAIGLALTKHDRSIIYRREGKQVQAIIDRIMEIRGSREGFNSQTGIWRMQDRQVELGGVQRAGDEIAYQGRPHDLKVFDEITHFLESQFRFLCGWLRSTKPGQRQRILCTGNPPTDPEGEWVVKFWAPWLDPEYPNPAKEGELRWFAMVDGEEKEVDQEPFEHNGEWIQPRSRTFIKSLVEDNPFLMETDYKATLQALPEPLRSQMLKGDFSAGKDDNPWQVIPTEWVEKAQARWKPDGKSGEMDALGMDVARGGADETVLSARYGHWFSELDTYPGKSTPDGPTAAALAVGKVRNGAPIQVDVIGVGGSVVDHLKTNNLHVIEINSAEKSEKRDKSGKLKFYNKRAELWWLMRESLDPDLGDDIALPPDRELKVDLCTPRWKLTARGIQVESKEEIYKRIQRSTNKGDAVVYAREPNMKKKKEYKKPQGGHWLGS